MMQFHVSIHGNRVTLCGIHAEIEQSNNCAVDENNVKKTTLFSFEEKHVFFLNVKHIVKIQSKSIN